MPVLRTIIMTKEELEAQEKERREYYEDLAMTVGYGSRFSCCDTDFGA